MKRKYSLLSLLMILLCAQSISAQQPVLKKDIAGSWNGSINTGTGSLRVVFHLKYHDNDSLSATLDSPDQGAKDIPLGNVKIKKDSVVIEAPMLVANYRGLKKNDATMEGTWTQGGYKFPLILKKQ